jgi:hypothetical protein
MKPAALSRLLVLAPLALSSSLATADSMRDPTRPPMTAAHAAAPEPPPVLSAIIGTGAARVAIFNGHVVRSGGTVGDYAIEEVFDDGVRYRHGGETHDVFLPHTSEFKKPAAAADPPTGVH